MRSRTRPAIRLTASADGFRQAFRRYAAMIIDDQRRLRCRGGCDQFRAPWDIPHNMQLIIGEPQFPLREVSALFVRKDDQLRRARRCPTRPRQDGMQRPGDGLSCS